MENDLPYDIDITEIEGFDDLHHAEGILKEAQERAAALYHAEETHFLINGSTAGILSAIMGCVPPGGRILAARNCHKSVYHAIEMQQLSPVFVYPDYDVRRGINGEISPEDIEEQLVRFPDIRAVVIVSPTYDGVVSDVKKIAEIVHRFGIPLIVDEAHGAHFGFHPYFPENANILGADLVIHSLHKTMPAPTQTALIHMNGTCFDREAVRRFLHMLQTSSPSYILMSGIDECIRLISERGEKLFAEYTDNLKQLRSALKGMQNLQLLETKSFDYSKILISVKDCKITAKEIYKLLLEKYHLQMEMAAGTYILAMTAVGDTRAGMDRLQRALLEINAEAGDGVLMPDAAIQRKDEMAQNAELFRMEPAKVVYTCAQMRERLREGAGAESIRWENCGGCISAEYVYLYPPGIPLLVPGERVTEHIVQQLCTYRELGFTIQGAAKEGFLEVEKDG